MLVNDELKVLSEVEYWKQRCLLAEKCLEESPCDPDITQAQIAAHQAYDHFMSNSIEPSNLSLDQLERSNSDYVDLFA